MKYRRLWRLAMRTIVLGLHYQLYRNEFVNYSLEWDSLEVTSMELDRKTIAIFMRLYLKMAILKNSAKTNMMRMLPMHAYPSEK